MTPSYLGFEGERSTGQVWKKEEKEQQEGEEGRLDKIINKLCENVPGSNLILAIFDHCNTIIFSFDCIKRSK